MEEHKDYIDTAMIIFENSEVIKRINDRLNRLEDEVFINNL